MPRWLPFIASFWCAPVIILAFHTLFAGYGNTSLEGAAIITFNTSSLGLADYYQTNSTLHSNVTALVPPSITNPTAINRFLGIKDWYSLHYLSTCSGFFEANGEVLTSTKINTTCVTQKSGYVYTISNVLRDELDPSITAIADEVTQASYYTAPWIALWYIGIITAIVEMFIFLPLTWYGTRRLNGYSTLVSFISFLCFNVASGLTYGHSLYAYHSQTLPPALRSTEFFVMTWITMSLVLVVLILVQFEFRFELWTLKGENITIYRKPPYKSWNLLDSLWNRNPKKIQGAGRDEEYQMQ